MKYFFFFLFIIALQVAFSQQSNLLPQTKVEVEKEQNLGQVRQGLPLKIVYKFLNIGQEYLIFSMVKTSSGSVIPEYDREPIAPGQIGTVTLTFDTRNRLGNSVKSTTVWGNFNDGVPIVLTFCCEIIAE